MTKLSFDIQSPSGLLLKLRYDIARLKNARYSDDVRYAAFDCAIDGWHLVDWLLSAVTDAQHLSLCGLKRGTRQGTSKGFVQRNSARLPGLAHCQQIANTGKHVVLSKPADPLLSAKTTVRFLPPFDSSKPETLRSTNMSPVAFIQFGAVKTDAVDFFMELERGWRSVLIEEGHLNPGLRSAEIEFPTT